MINNSVTNSVASNDRQYLLEEDKHLESSDPYADPKQYSKVNQLLANEPQIAIVEDQHEMIMEEKRHSKE